MRRIAVLIILVIIAASCGEGGREKRANSASGKKEMRKNPASRDKDIQAGKEDAQQSPGTAGTEEQSDAVPASGSEDAGIEGSGAGMEVPAGAILIGSDIVTEVIIKPDPKGDPWEVEKVAGYQGEAMVNSIFTRIYDGTLKVYDYHSGEELSTSDVKKIEEDFQNDRTKIGKLSFTEDWYYFPEENRVEKRAKSVTFGYELYNNVGKVYAYRAAFRADFN